MKTGMSSYARPLVSVVMPAYKAIYLKQALESIAAQTYRPLELVICDDSTTDEIERIVDAFASVSDVPVRYFRNDTRLWEMRSTARGVSAALGKYIKLFHDDDVLDPECIASLTDVMERDSSVALASSRRRRIDEDGKTLPDMLGTFYPFREDVIIHGQQLVSFLGEYTINFIGEPSTVLCRREDLLKLGDKLSTLNGVRITWVADLAIYVQLLQIGHLAMLAQPLTNFRVSREQFSQIGRNAPGIGDAGHENFRRAIRDLGWLRGAGDNRKVDVAPITRLDARVFRSMDLWAAIQRSAGLGSVPLFAWLGAKVPNDIQRSLIQERLATADGGPRIAIAIFASDTKSDELARTLRSLNKLACYSNMEVHVLSDNAPTDPLPGICFWQSNAGRAGGLNTLLQDRSFDWLMPVMEGVEFTVSGLTICALELMGAPDGCLAVYADEVMQLDDGERGIALRPDFNLDYLLSFPCALASHWIFRRDALLQASGFDREAGDAFELEICLRFVEQYGLGCIGHVSEPILISRAFALADSPDERRVIGEHLRKRGYEAGSVSSRLPGRYDIDYNHDRTAGVSILVCTGGKLARIQRCVETVLQHSSNTPHEILIIHGGNAPKEVETWLRDIEALGAAEIRVLRFAERDVASRCNRAAAQARGDVLLWLDEGAGVLSDDWLPQMLNHALRPEVGAVSAKLLSADGKVRYAGSVLGLTGPVGRVFEGASLEEPGYMHRLQVDQNYLSLSRECLMVRRDVFLDAGGFAEDSAITRWIDTDLCLRLHQAGYLNVWTPRVQLLMDVEPDVPASAGEEDAMYARWMHELARDPSYNAGFSVDVEPGFKLGDPHLSWQPLASWRPLPVVLAHNADTYGCGHYRVIQPFNAMRNAGLLEGNVSIELLSPVALERYNPNVVVLQRQVGDERLESMRRMKAFSSAFKVYELDDYLPNLPMKSVHREHMPKDILKTLRRGLGYVDRFVVSTHALAEAFDGIHPDIRVVENRLPSVWWRDMKAARRAGAKPRVGWAGGSSHTGDLELIADVVKELSDEVEWVFFGMCPDKLRPFIHEFHPGVEIHRYPDLLAGLNLDLALAPVEQNLFNECKSNLRVLEYGACGFPVIASDVRCYRGTSLPVTLVKNRFRDWVDAIRMHVSDLDASAQLGDALRDEVRRSWMLEGAHLEAWQRAWLPD